MDTKTNRALIAKLLSDNVDFLYDRDKTRIWKIIKHELLLNLKVSSGITFDWKDIRKMFKSSILYNLENFPISPQMIQQIRFPFLDDYHGIPLFFEDKPYDPKRLIGPRQQQRINFYVQYKLSNKYSERIYENISSIVPGISSYGININDPRLNVNTKERNALKKFCKKSPTTIKRDQNQHDTQLSSQWIGKRKLHAEESENLAIQPPKKVARTVLKEKENTPCGDDDILIVSSDTDDEGNAAVNQTIVQKKDTVRFVSIEAPRGQVTQLKNENLSKPADMSKGIDIKKCNINISSVQASEVNKSLLEPITSKVAVSCDKNASNESTGRSALSQLEKTSAAEPNIVIIKADVLSTGAVDDNDQMVLRLLEKFCLATPGFRLYVDPDRMQHFNPLTSTFDYDV